MPFNPELLVSPLSAITSYYGRISSSLYPSLTSAQTLLSEHKDSCAKSWCVFVHMCACFGKGSVVPCCECSGVWPPGDQGFSCLQVSPGVLGCGFRWVPGLNSDPHTCTAYLLSTISPAHAAPLSAQKSLFPPGSLPCECWDHRCAPWGVALRWCNVP